MNTLLNRDEKGYPTPYLMARLRGRRIHFIQDWENILSSINTFDALYTTPYGDLISEYAQEGIWKRFLKELHWVYFQMNRHLKDIFYPFFLYCELKTVIICLRHRLEKQTAGDIADLLVFSILSERVKGLLRKKEDLSVIIDIYAKEFLPLSYNARELRDIFSREGLKGVEEEIISECLGEIKKNNLHPAVEDFFSYIIDIKNIIAFYKYTRWNVTHDPVFIEGGSITIANLKSAVRTKKNSELERFIRQRTGRVIQNPTASGIEHVLLSDLTRRIRFNSRSSDITQILDYLWKIYIEARNLSILSYGSALERETLREELVIE